MIIKKIKLNNIRSYANQEINFPIGSTLLAGNVGSGKSTILMSIDFALFGLQKGNITGSSLLRNDADKGQVELELEIEDKNVIIKRGLKREGDKILQDSGSLTVNNEKQELTATEIKQKILELLNYPRELLTKSKAIIYRYTVYTPQEEMKSILSAEKDVRLDVLRKIFGIDKYKRIKENSKIFVSMLKEKKKEFQGMISDLKEKESLSSEFKNKILVTKEKINIITPKLNLINSLIETKKQKIKNIEENIKKLNSLKQELKLNENNTKNKSELKIKNLNEINNLKGEISLFKEEKFDAVSIRNEIIEKENKTKKIENEIKNLSVKISELKINKKNSESMKEEISKLNTCPTCKQNVKEEHKNNIKNEEDEKIISYESELEVFTKNMEVKENEFMNIKKDLDFLNKKEQEFNVYRLRLENTNEKKKRLDLLVKDVGNLEQELSLLSVINTKLNTEINSYDNIDKEYNEIRKEFDENLIEQRKTEIEKISFEKELENINNNLLALEKEILNKLNAREKLEKHTQLQNWFDMDFSNLLENMEKQIMFKIYHDFNSLFQKWFSMLIDNENLVIKLDNEFSPLIQQNNHDIDYEFISGGERTAAALSYRLALNQVINNLITNIRTKDLLILDEPTDGFSSEQLDRIRLVLDELNIKQTIIVSHDPKIESFVDNVIRLNKKDHITEIV
ncbi:MAG: hypothetical protein KKD48_00230 [Nanoarchaeota archaeon]|nr:hypothetical protein [Nanoarchaeota archaeon]